MKNTKPEFKAWGPSNVARALSCPSALAAPYGRSPQAELPKAAEKKESAK